MSNTCLDCGGIFDDDDLDTEMINRDKGGGEMDWDVAYSCPVCGSDDLESDD